MFLMILLDRRCLLECNGDAWRDEYGAIFIIFTIKEMMKLLHLGNKKINKMLKELEVHNLIYRSHQGLGKPKKISAVFRLYESYCKKMMQHDIIGLTKAT